MACSMAGVPRDATVRQSRLSPDAVCLRACVVCAGRYDRPSCDAGPGALPARAGQGAGVFGQAAVVTAVSVGLSEIGDEHDF